MVNDINPLWIPPQPPEPYPPVYYEVVPVMTVVQYTDVSQFEYFKFVINRAYDQDVNVRFEEDGHTLRWLSTSVLMILKLGEFLVDGKHRYSSEEQLRVSTLRPISLEWPEKIGIEPTYPPHPVSLATSPNDVKLTIEPPPGPPVPELG